MAMTLEQLSESDLLNIVNSKKWSDLEAAFSKAELQQLIKEVKHPVAANHPNNKISQSLLTALTDAPSYPFIILWTLVGLVSLSVIPLTLITAGFFALTLISGGIFFYSSHNDLKKEAHKIDNNLRLTALKIACTKELIKRKTFEIDAELSDKNTVNLQDLLRFNPLPKLIYKDKNKWTRIKNSLGAATMISSILFGTYYLGIGAVVTAFGLTSVASVLLGPIGIGVMLAVACLIGIAFGYKCYQAQKNSEELRKQQKQMQQELNSKNEEYEELNNRLKSLENKKSHPHKNPVKLMPKTKISKRYKFSLHPMIFMNSRRRAINRNFYVPKRIAFKKP